jgi:hypothetical protein
MAFIIKKSQQLSLTDFVLAGEFLELEVCSDVEWPLVLYVPSMILPDSKSSVSAEPLKIYVVVF